MPKLTIETTQLEDGGYLTTPLIDGQINGFVKRYDSKKCLICETPYVDGKIDGKQTWYMPSGAISRTVAFVKGIRHGFTTWYRSDRTIEAETMWENGHEELTTYHPRNNA